MLSLDLHDKFSAINIHWLVSGSSLAGLGDIKDSALWCRNKKRPRQSRWYSLRLSITFVDRGRQRPWAL